MAESLENMHNNGSRGLLLRHVLFSGRADKGHYSAMRLEQTDSEGSDVEVDAGPAPKKAVLRDVESDDGLYTM